MDTFDNPVKPPDILPLSPPSTQRIPTVNATLGNRLAITTTPHNLLVPKPSSSTSDTEDCRYLHALDTENSLNFTIVFLNFQAHCQGVYTLWNDSGLITAALFLLNDGKLTVSDLFHVLLSCSVVFLSCSVILFASSVVCSSYNVLSQMSVHVVKWL